MYMYKGKDIREIVKNDEWQKIRLSFIGTWKKPNDNINIFRQYIGDCSDEMKLVRVYNYLTGTAFRLGIISSKEIDSLREKVKESLLNY